MDTEMTPKCVWKGRRSRTAETVLLELLVTPRDSVSFRPRSTPECAETHRGWTAAGPHGQRDSRTRSWGMRPFSPWKSVAPAGLTSHPEPGWPPCGTVPCGTRGVGPGTGTVCLGLSPTG